MRRKTQRITLHPELKNKAWLRPQHAVLSQNQVLPVHGGFIQTL